jgi:hypothetical protein
LNPVNLHCDEEVQWLETLVWPEQTKRAQRLRAAIEIARLDPPRVVKGDLLTDLTPLMAAAPKGATLVVFHTAVLGYVTPQAARDQLAATVRNANAIWISNEVPSVYPWVAASAPPPPSESRHLMSINGSPLAWTGPHGQSIDWFGSVAIPR